MSLPLCLLAVMHYICIGYWGCLYNHEVKVQPTNLVSWSRKCHEKEYNFEMNFPNEMTVCLIVSKEWLCCVILFQNIRKSGFGASDELSSEEEEGSPPEEIPHLVSLQERHPVATWPASSPSSSVRKRNLKLNHKPSLRPQVSFVLSAAAGPCNERMDEWMNEFYNCHVQIGPICFGTIRNNKNCVKL